MVCYTVTATTSAGQQAAFIPNHEITVTDRPVTGAGGLARMGRTPTAGVSGRQVQDAAYYMGLVQNKQEKIAEEIGRLKSETERMGHESDNIGGLEETYENLLREVRELEGTLADYNLAKDKARSGADPDEIIRYQKVLATKNNDLAGEIDQIFVLKQERAREAARFDDRIDDIHGTVEDKIQSIDPEKLRTYQGLVKRLTALHTERRRCEDEMANLRNKVLETETTMNGNICRNEFKKEEKKAEELKKRLDGLRENYMLSQMDRKEARSYLIDKVKGEQLKTSDIEKNIERVVKEIEGVKKTQDELQAEMNDNLKRSTGGDESEKWNLLFEKDGEITSFLSSSEDSREKMAKEQMQTQSIIVALLEHISEGVVASKEDMPERHEVQELKGDVSFKQKQLESSKRTMTRLQNQKVRRTQEVSLPARKGGKKSTCILASFCAEAGFGCSIRLC